MLRHQELRLTSKYKLKSEYGITPEQYDKMFFMQKGKCPICLAQIYKSGATHRRASPVDHDHGPSKRVRGLACFGCNRYRIGRNTVETAKRLVKYLESTFDGREL